MSFVVEDGTGLSDANAYVSVAGFKAYADDKGASYSAYTDPQIEQALVRATAYVDGAFRDQFPGFKVNNRDQALEWPRSWAADRTGFPVDPKSLPAEVVRATSESAIRELASPGALNPDIKAGGGIVKRVKAGSVEVEYEANNQTTKVFQIVEQMLGSLLIVRSSYSGATARA